MFGRISWARDHEVMHQISNYNTKRKLTYILSTNLKRRYTHAHVASCMPRVCNTEMLRNNIQGSPQEIFKAQWVGVVWAEFVTTSIILVATSKKYGY